MTVAVEKDRVALFMLSGDPDEKMRLRSFSSRTSGIKATVTITLETTDMHVLAYCLNQLDGVFKQQGSSSKTKPKGRIPPPSKETV